MFWWRLSFTLGALPLMVPLLSVIPRLLVQLPFCVWDLPTRHLLLSRPRTVMGLGCSLGVIMAGGGTLGLVQVTNSISGLLQDYQRH